MTGIERKLTTILAADVVGFSKMMGRDETGTLANLKDCRAIIDSGIAEHRGRIFGSAGDSVVAEFSSPVQAVLCANEFQKLLAKTVRCAPLRTSPKALENQAPQLAHSGRILTRLPCSIRIGSRRRDLSRRLGGLNQVRLRTVPFRFNSGGSSCQKKRSSQ